MSECIQQDFHCSFPSALRPTRARHWHPYHIIIRHMNCSKDTGVWMSVVGFTAGLTNTIYKAVCQSIHKVRFWPSSVLLGAAVRLRLQRALSSHISSLRWAHDDKTQTMYMLSHVSVISEAKEFYRLTGQSHLPGLIYWWSSLESPDSPWWRSTATIRFNGKLLPFHWSLSYKQQDCELKVSTILWYWLMRHQWFEKRCLLPDFALRSPVSVERL